MALYELAKNSVDARSPVRISVMRLNTRKKAGGHVARGSARLRDPVLSTRVFRRLPCYAGNPDEGLISDTSVILRNPIV